MQSKNYNSIIQMIGKNINTKPNKQEFITFPDNVLPLKPYYEKIFVDIVSETFTSGTTCFITEKTVRPIVYKCPFIIMAGKGYLKALKKFGFKTFDAWWSEEYDNYTGPERIEKIVQLINTLSKENIKALKVELQNTIEHNYNHIIKGEWKNNNYRFGIVDD